MQIQDSVLPLKYPGGIDLREKLLLCTRRLELRRLLQSVEAIRPIEFTDASPELIPLRTAWRVCIQYDCPVVEVIHDADLNGRSGTLSGVLRRQLGARSFGYLSIFGELPWVKIAITDPQSDWVDAVRNAGARDFLFMTEDGKHLFAVIDEGHDPINLCISLDAAEVTSRAATTTVHFSTTG